MDRDHELAAVLADDTRYRVYRSIAESPRDEVTVADIAERFSLHPNVARMHLAKLEQAGFLDTGLRKTSAGGRPARLYRLSEKVLTFGFPPRRYELLARLALGVLTEGGDRPGIEAACREMGVAEGRQALGTAGGPPADRQTAAALVARVAEEQGLLPEVEWDDGSLHLTVRNCAFQELSGADPELVCAMHRAFLAGVLEVVLGPLGTVTCADEGGRLSLGDDRCRLVCTLRD
ncbi:MAG TPA: helix-turn-helix domain-containing protein [Thermoleophilia bacterium]|nr:helix-turn-helix domain-containing protein [Thermoleophilia bacterium]